MARSTSAQLRADIDAGRTGAKVAAPDPAASPLGTDDEAAGNTPTADRVEMARRAERKIAEAQPPADGEQVPEKPADDPREQPTKRAGAEVGPPGERVDDEAGRDEGKKTHRQE